MEGKCSVDGCPNGIDRPARGLCHTHYSRLQRTGSVQAHIPVQQYMFHDRPGTVWRRHKDPYPQIDIQKIIAQTFS